jgi:putative phage-type endonuclease
VVIDLLGISDTVVSEETMTTLQQRTKAWHSARAGKLTASNLAGVLGLSQFSSRSESYDRLMGRSKFEGNDATRWGAANEQNGINAYQTRTGNLVEPTGLWTHTDFMWLAGSPDGLIGSAGMLEVKCPYYRKIPHQKIPIYYYIQIIACLEMTNREWCDYVCWTPNSGTTMFRVMRDHELFDFLLPWWGQVYSCLQRGVEQLPPLKPEAKVGIEKRVRESMEANINYTFYDRAPDEPDSPPCLSSHDPDSGLEDEKVESDCQTTKRQKLNSET